MVLPPRYFFVDVFFFLGGSNFRAIEFKVECLVFAVNWSFCVVNFK